MAPIRQLDDEESDAATLPKAHQRERTAQKRMLGPDYPD